MKKNTLTVALALLIATGTYAQDYVFKVLANKGSNEVKSGDSWQPLKTGASLKTGDELKISDNAYLGLVHVKGQPVEIKQSGNYKVTDLAGKVSSGNSVLSKYTDFILSSNSAEAKKNRLSATGAVHRGETAVIQLLLPENQHSGVFNNEVVVSWEGTKVAGPYIITFRNMFDDELGKVETPETTYKLDLTDPKFSRENAVLIEVKSKSDAKQVSKQHLIKKLSPAEQEGVKKSLNEISPDLKEATALNKLILAGFYEEHKLYIDAISAYEEAIRLAPDVPSYKEAYEEFLIRQGIKR
jgi:hypothetical protein